MFSCVGKGLMIGRISALEFQPNIYKIKALEHARRKGRIFTKKWRNYGFIKAN
jgi:hypothetical protein